MAVTVKQPMLQFKVVTLMKTVIWHDQGSETVRQRLKDVDEAHRMIQEVGSRSREQNIEGAVSDF